MQTTLLGLAIALILALVTALVAPLLVDWGRFRPEIEAEASRLIGAPVRITGPIDATLLPTPVLTLRGLQVGPPDAPSAVRARSLGVELHLGSLLRGEWRAQQLRLVGPDFNLGMDAAGNLALPPIAPGFDPDRLSIERLHIEDGRAVLEDLRSGSRVSLDKLGFNGEVRSLVGPLKGDGAFFVDGDAYTYRIAAGRADEGTLKLRLNIAPREKAIAFEADGMLSLAGAAPRFDGSITIARPAGVALPSGQTVASEPWRLTSKTKATATFALFEGAEFQYGPEERAVRLTGTAELKFGDKPRFGGIIAGVQIDLDRAFAAPDVARQLPFAVLKALGESFSAVLRPSIPARIGVSVDTLTLAGSTIQNLRGDMRSDGEAWSLDGFELRAPGLTQVTLSGRLDLAPGRLGFTGPVSVDSANPSALVAWLEGTSAQSPTRLKPFRASGEVTLGSAKIAFQRLNAEIDRKSVEGNFAYTWPTREKPAQLDADLTAEELDIDALLSLAGAARGSTVFEFPREATVGLSVGRAQLAGVTASNLNVRFRQNAGGLQVERLSIGDFGGNSLNASGRVDATSTPPQGTLNVRLDARDLAGMVALAEKFMPNQAAVVRHLALRIPQVQLNAVLVLEPNGAAKLALDGRSTDLRLALRGESARGANASADLQSLVGADLRLEGKLESGKATALVELLSLGSVVAVDPDRPGELNFSAKGPFGALAVATRLVAGNLDASANGVLNLRADQPKAELRLTVARADARPLRRSTRPEPLPVNLTGNLALTAHAVALDNLSGTFGGIPTRGKLAIDFARETRIEGRLEAESLEAHAMLAALIGMPPTPDGRGWSAEPFGQGLLEGAQGRIELRAGRANITPTLTLREARGALQFSGSEISFVDLEGGMADGQFKGRLQFHKRDSGVSANGHLRLSNADAASLLAHDGKAGVTGRVALNIDVEGAGMSPQTLIGSLNGNGMLSVTRARLPALNARVFETATRAIDQGVALDMKKIGEVAASALENGTLSMTAAEGVVTISNGHIRLTNLETRAEGADLTVTGSVDLMEQNLSARLALSGGNRASQPAGERPVVSVLLNGPITQPKRTVDVSALTTWLTLRMVERQSKQLEAMEAKRRAALTEHPSEESRPPQAVPQATAPIPQATAPSWFGPATAPMVIAPGSPAAAPPLPPAIEIPSLPSISDERPARAPTRVQRPAAAQPRPSPGIPLPLLPPSARD